MPPRAPRNTDPYRGPSAAELFQRYVEGRQELRRIYLSMGWTPESDEEEDEGVMGMMPAAAPGGGPRECATEGCTGLATTSTGQRSFRRRAKTHCDTCIGERLLRQYRLPLCYSGKRYLVDFALLLELPL